MEELVRSEANTGSGTAALRLRKTRWAWLLATWFGAGYLQPGPGTYGSATAVALWLVAGQLLHHNTALLTIGTACAATLITVVGIAASTIVASEAGRKDPGFVVVDEVAGQWVALLFVPPLWPNALVMFILFRFFDILKPPPIRRFESLPNGTGIMADDLAAGVFALGAGLLILHFMQRFQ